MNESDELSKTAGELLDRVSHDQSQKFKQSNFLALMRQLRDREIVVDGDEFRKVQQPLHPGGPLYPEQSKISGSLPVDLDSTKHNGARLPQHHPPYFPDMRVPSESLDEDKAHAGEDRNAIYQKILWKSQLPQILSNTTCSLSTACSLPVSLSHPKIPTSQGSASDHHVTCSRRAERSDRRRKQTASQQKPPANTPLYRPPSAACFVLEELAGSLRARRIERPWPNRPLVKRHTPYGGRRATSPPARRPTTTDCSCHSDPAPKYVGLSWTAGSKETTAKKDEDAPGPQVEDPAVSPFYPLPPDTTRINSRLAFRDLSTVDNNRNSRINPPPRHSLPSGSSSSSSSALSPLPPSFSSLYSSADHEEEEVGLDRFNNSSLSVAESGTSSPPTFAPAPPFEEASPSSAPVTPRVVTETKAELSRDKGESSGKGQDDGEPPPPYTEGSIPLQSFTYVMAAAGGASSIITQVQQTGGPPLNSLGDIGGDEHITLDLRGMRFTLSRDELLTLPEFVLLSLFPNGLLPDGHMGSFHEGDVYPVDYDPLSLQYMLDFFRAVAQSIPSSSPSPTTSPTVEAADPIPNPARDMLQDRAGIIVLREDLDFYTIPPTAEIEHPEMMEIKRAAGRALLKQDGIFSGLRKSDEPGSTEQHLIEMLTAGVRYSGFNHDDRWGHRAGEPNKAVICSLALAKLRTDIRGDMANSNAVGMAQKAAPSVIGLR
ncbi:Growth regulation protein [Trichophyton tonsurans CBS 112818]|uniref:Growth regulation protein n=1 Tax=Trichophyton tonsurans (strain CBS 112818) TaxID=647933 RepID=F2S556_TRIT1|nr:Growth regulation protein [Trichophyton tonsurans CBS 112818]